MSTVPTPYAPAGAGQKIISTKIIGKPSLSLDPTLTHRKGKGGKRK